MSTNITERAAQVLQQIDAALALAEKATAGLWTEMPAETTPATSFIKSKDGCVAHHAWKRDAAFIAASRTLLPTSLRCLKTSIEGLLAAREWNEQTGEEFMPRCASLTLASLLDTWEAAK